MLKNVGKKVTGKKVMEKKSQFLVGNKVTGKKVTKKEIYSSACSKKRGIFDSPLYSFPQTKTVQCVSERVVNIVGIWRKCIIFKLWMKMEERSGNKQNTRF